MNIKIPKHICNDNVCNKIQMITIGTHNSNKSINIKSYHECIFYNETAKGTGFRIDIAIAKSVQRHCSMYLL